MHPEVAVLHLSPTRGNPQRNLALAADALRRAKEARPNLRWVVLPELFTSGYADLPSVHRHAEDAVAGPSAASFAHLARELDLYVAYGFPERLHDGEEDGPGVANAANLVGPEGVLLTYRKRKLIGQSPEPEAFAPGGASPVVEAGGVPVALAICWDLMFPEVVREAAVAGALLVLAPSAWEDPYGPQYGRALSARALDNAAYVASANQQGDYPEASFTAPGGVFRFDGARVDAPLSSPGDAGGGVAPVDLDALKGYRAEFGTMLDELGVPRPGREETRR